MKQRKEIWTIDLSDIVNEEGVNHRLCAGIYEDMDSAIETAKKIVEEYVGDGRILEATVYHGEYMDESGNILGEPYDIFTATNVSPDESSSVRLDEGFCSHYVDYYAEDPAVRWEYVEYKGKKYRAATIVSPFTDCNFIITMVSNDVTGLIIGVDGQPYDQDASAFDSKVYGYCPDEWFDLTQSEFVDKVRKYFD